ncbi:MAG: hypothetical protein IT546_11135 [Caulobacteraceae bacterium]|nr:hypothetical protein [Caulobacteraceae bacterium]
MARQGDAEAISELEGAPKLPPLASHLWAIFLDLSATRQSTGFGVGRITRHDIRIWEEDEGRQLDRWERRALLRLDAAYLKSMAESAKEGSGQGQPAR